MSRRHQGAPVRRIKRAVAAVGSNNEIGLGPRTVKRPRALHGADDVATALHDEPTLPQSPLRLPPEMDDQQNDTDTYQNLPREQQPRIGSAGQHEEKADYRGPASDCCQGVAHGYIIARGG